MFFEVFLVQIWKKFGKRIPKYLFKDKKNIGSIKETLGVRREIFDITFFFVYKVVNEDRI
jgi:hypothetical protein